MVCPVAEAEPAEFAATLAAHHVHAALGFLYGPLALGAGLGVCQDPVGILTLCAVLAQPHAHSCTVHLCTTHTPQFRRWLRFMLGEMLPEGCRSQIHVPCMISAT